MRETLGYFGKNISAFSSKLLGEKRLESFSQKINVIRAELMMKVAGLIFDNHENPLLKSVSKAAGWANKQRYGGRKALDFLENEESIDIMDDSQYEKMTKKK